MTSFRHQKYGLLQHIPGKIGRSYEGKHLAAISETMFMKAAEATSGLTAVDLGANVGRYTAILAERSKLVVAFEPDTWSVERLRENTSHFNNVKIVEAAAGVADCEVQLYRRDDFDSDPDRNSLSSSTVATKMNVSQDNPRTVQQIDIVKYLKELEGEIGILKIDIEGAEVDVLETLFADAELLQRIHYIFAETHENKIPGQVERVDALRSKARNMRRPKVNLYWH